MVYGRYVDVTNDGRDDLLMPTNLQGGPWYAYFSDGTTFEAGAVLPFDPAYLESADVTGDGHRDVIYLMSSSWHVWPRVAELEAVTNFWDGLGNWQQVTYQSYATLDYLSEWSTPSLPVTRRYRGPISIVDQVEANSGVGVESYTYATGVVGDSFVTRYFYWDAMADNRGRGFLGFGYVRAKDYRQGYHFDREFLHPFPVTGWLSWSHRGTPAGQYIDQYDPAAPDVTSMGPGRYFVHVDEEVYREYELGQVLTRTIERTRTFNTTSGVIAQEKVKTLTPSGDWDETTTDFTLLDIGSCLGLPDGISVKRSGYNFVQAYIIDEKTRSLDNTFDSACRLESTINTSEGDPSQQLKETRTYDGFGNVKTITLNSANGAPSNQRKTEFLR